jgi:hypothetical protein
MTINEMLSALEGGDHELYPIATEDDVRTTEKVIGPGLPHSFREFVKSFSNGAYLYGIQEVSAVGEGNAQIAAIQKIILPGRPEPHERIPFRDGGDISGSDLVPFSLDHNGNAWCFLTTALDPDGEYSVAYFCTTGKKLYGKQASFAEWLGILIETENEVIRTLYDDDVLNDELELG